MSPFAKSLGLRGRPAFRLTKTILEKVYEAAKCQMKMKDIAGIIGITPSTLSKKKKELELLEQTIEAGRVAGLNLVSAGMFKNATTPMRKFGQPGGNVRAQEFILERKGGWKKEITIEGNPEKPVHVQIVLPDNGRPRRIVDAK